MFLTGMQIRELAENAQMISPFVPAQLRVADGQGVPSFGLGYAGYDIRIQPRVRVMLPGLLRSHRLDIRDSSTFERVMSEEEHDTSFVIPANSFALAQTVEHFRMPEDIMAIALGKSTYARAGIAVNITPLEPGWSGYLVVEIHNNAPYDNRVLLGGGIAQLLFAKLPNETAGYRGAYQNQTGIVLPTLADSDERD